MQSRLEKNSIEERETEFIKNEYSNENPYSTTHKNATSDGDLKGKGTNHGGHTVFLPDGSKSKTMIEYSNFDTENGGNKIDIEKRKEAMMTSLYNKDYPYGAHLINTEENQRKGQFKL